jgi:two-component system response regulator RegX3
MGEAVILVVEDEPSFVEALNIGLVREGFTVHVAVDGVDALEKFDAVSPDLVLLDVMLPRLSGIEVCRQIRKKSGVPSIMVTAKPYRIRELAARIRAVLRRSGEASDSTAGLGTGTIEVGAVMLDPEAHLITLAGDELTLPLKEFELLHLLLVNAGRVLPRETLIDRIWGHDYVGDTKTLDVHIKRLRSKLEADPTNPQLITTIRGLGYKYSR